MNINIKVSQSGDKVTLEIDPTKDYGLSSSGKTHIVASTGGFVDVPGTDIKINATAIRMLGG